MRRFDDRRKGCCDAAGHGRIGGRLLGAEPEGDIIQHSFWLFDTEENARAAEATFSQLRDMPGAPATFISVEVCEIVGHA